MTTFCEEMTLIAGSVVYRRHPSETTSLYFCFEDFFTAYLNCTSYCTVFTIYYSQRTVLFSVMSDLPMDSLKLSTSVSGKFNFEDTFSVLANTPIASLDTSQVSLMVSDTIPANYSFELDTLNNKVDFDFEAEPNQKYSFSFLPGAITDFFGIQNDTLDYNLSTGGLSDYGNLTMILGGEVNYPVIVQLTNEKGVVQREISAAEPQSFEFNNLSPGNYIARVVLDKNGNGQWDTGNFLEKRQPEEISYYPGAIEIRANWIKEETFILSN